MKKEIISTLILGGFTALSANAISIFGLGVNGNLYSFDSATPGTFNTIGVVGNSITDIDFRGSNRVLYGLSSNGQGYRINTITGASTSAFTPASALNGNVSAFDVNPVADRFRVGTDAVMGNNNYRLTSAGGDTSTVNADGTFITPGFSILDVAYLNPFTAGTTTLYSIGSDANLYSHTTTSNDPAGTFNSLTFIGNVGFTPTGDLSFDIADDEVGYFTSGNRLYSIASVGNVATLGITDLGALAQPLRSISTIPEPSAGVLAALAGLGLLRRRR